MIKIIITIIIVIFALSAHADKSRVPTYRFSVVSQQSESRTTLVWKPLLQFLFRDTGYRFQLKIDRDISSFEKQLMNGQYDFSYMAPHHYAVFHEAPGYIAIAKAKSNKTGGYTPLVIAAHPRVPLFVLNRVQASLIRLEESQQGRQMLYKMKIEDFRVTEGSDWDDGRARNIDLLK